VPFSPRQSRSLLGLGCLSTKYLSITIRLVDADIGPPNFFPTLLFFPSVAPLIRRDRLTTTRFFTSSPGLTRKLRLSCGMTSTFFSFLQSRCWTGAPSRSRYVYHLNSTLEFPQDALSILLALPPLPGRKGASVVRLGVTAVWALTIGCYPLQDDLKSATLLPS